MCGKSSAPAASAFGANRDFTIRTGNNSATVHILQEGNKAMVIIGKGQAVQFLDAADLRELATHLNEVAIDLDLIERNLAVPA